MLVITMISVTPLLTSQGHVTLLLQFIMVLASDFCQYINLGGFGVFFCFQFTKQILKIMYYKSNTLIPENGSQ